MEKFWQDELRGGWDFGGQARRDGEARLALHYAKDGVHNLPHCLYLRPFDSVNRLPLQAGAGVVDMVSQVDFEQVLRKAVETLDRVWLTTRTYGPLKLVALGDRDAPIFGAGLAFSTEAEWREAFLSLAEAVQLIVIVPSARPSTLWELSQLASDHRSLRKTLFVMPETLYTKENIIEGEWDDAIEASRGAGVMLPVYQKKGMLFRLDEDGRLLGSRPLWLSHRLRRVKYLRRAISDLRAL